MRFQGALPAARRKRIRQDTGSRVRGGGISEADKADNRASLGSSVCKPHKRTCVCNTTCLQRKREEERENERTLLDSEHSRSY